MGGSKGHGHVRVIPRSLIFIAYQHRNGGTKGGFSIQQATQNLHLVGFFSRRGDVTLSWFTTVQFCLDFI